MRVAGSTIPTALRCKQTLTATPARRPTSPSTWSSPQTAPWSVRNGPCAMVRGYGAVTPDEQPVNTLTIGSRHLPPAAKHPHE